MNFDQFLLPVQIQTALKEMGYTTPTPIQEKAIPIGLSKRDLIGCAQTGTGKTIAFLVPLVTHLLKSPRKDALILLPTRELAQQVAAVFKKLTKHTDNKLRSAVLIGGVPMQKQIKMLGKPSTVFIATPGRLCDHLRRGNLSLRAAEVLVLDEADRMLDMGFTQQINEVMRFVPSARQTFMFSATLPPTIEKLASKFMNSPIRINVGDTSEPVEKIAQHARHVSSAAGKKEMLKQELNQRAGSVLVFTRTKKRADSLCKFLLDTGHSAGKIHGGRTQGQRSKTLDGFKDGQFQILIATDIVSRGIDIENISHVINFDVPRCPEDYIHRIGRTARAGAKGQALSLIAPEEKGQWAKISHFLQSKS